MVNAKKVLTIAVVVLLTSSLPWASARGVEPTLIRVVLVEPEGERFEPEEMDHAILSVQEAMDWWNDLAPVSKNLVISDTILVTSTADIFSVPMDMTNSTVDSVYMVDNTASGRLIFNARVGAMTSRHQVWVVNGIINTNAVVAHEFGHLIWDLPDWYSEPGGCGGVIDIMCFDVPAYYHRTIGCLSLERMGHPCRRVYIPYATR